MTATRNVLVLGKSRARGRGAPRRTRVCRSRCVRSRLRPAGWTSAGAMRSWSRRALRSPRACSPKGSALRVIGCAGEDTAAIDVAELTRRGILVVNAPDCALISEAEHALALVLAVARDLAGADAALRRGDASRRAGAGAEVRGKTLGLVGVRPSSSLLVERARSLGMEVLACEAQAPGEVATGLVECVAPEQVLTQADVLVAQTPAGLRFFGAAELAQLAKAGVRLVSPRGRRGPRGAGQGSRRRPSGRRRRDRRGR